MRTMIGILCFAIAISAVLAIFIIAYGVKPTLIAFGIAALLILLVIVGGWLLAG